MVNYSIEARKFNFLVYNLRVEEVDKIINHDRPQATLLSRVVLPFFHTEGNFYLTEKDYAKNMKTCIQ